MKTEDKLDAVLSALDHSEIHPEDYDQIKARLTIDINQKELGLILNKLVDDNYANIQHASSNGKPTSDKYFQITYHGLLLLERGGFKRESRSQRHKQIWTIAKTTAITINAVIIILLAWLSYKNSVTSSMTESDIKNIEQEIIELKNEIKTRPNKK